MAKVYINNNLLVKNIKDIDKHTDKENDREAVVSTLKGMLMVQHEHAEQAKQYESQTPSNERRRQPTQEDLDRRFPVDG
jgi:hypothetical protein